MSFTIKVIVQGPIKVKNPETTEAIANSFQQLVQAIDRLTRRLPPRKVLFTVETFFGDIQKGIDNMYRAKADHPDQAITMPAATATDSEGDVIPLTNDRLLSTDENVVSIIDNPDGSGGKVLHVGAPGAATINRQATDDEGIDHVLASYPFAITHGDPVNVTSPPVVFGDLVDDGT